MYLLVYCYLLQFCRGISILMQRIAVGYYYMFIPHKTKNILYVNGIHTHLEYGTYSVVKRTITNILRNKLKR